MSDGGDTFELKNTYQVIFWDRLCLLHVLWWKLTENSIRKDEVKQAVILAIFWNNFH